MKNYIDYLDDGGFTRYFSKPLFEETKNVPNGSWMKGIYESLKQFKENLKKQNEQIEKINVANLQEPPTLDWINQHTTLEHYPDRGYLLVYTNNSSRNNPISSTSK